MSQIASEQVLATIMKETDQLDADQQLRLAAYLIERALSGGTAQGQQRRWRDLRGRYPYPALDEDAQQWVSRMRSEGDEKRSLHEDCVRTRCRDFGTNDVDTSDAHLRGHRAGYLLR